MTDARDVGAWLDDATAGDERTADRPFEPRWDLEHVQSALQLIDKKWTLRLLRALWDQDLRYHQLKHGTRIQAKVLSESLRRLERDGVVTRVFGPGTPAPVMYALTPLGRSLGTMLVAMQRRLSAPCEGLDLRHDRMRDALPLSAAGDVSEGPLGGGAFAHVVGWPVG